MTVHKDFGIVVLTLAMAGLACSEAPIITPLEVDPSFAKGGRGGGPGGGDDPPPPQITIVDAQGQRVTSDGGGAYVEGTERVDITFGIADFTFSPASHRRGTRSLFISLGDPVDGAVSPFAEDPTEMGYPGNLRLLEDLLAAPCDGVAREVAGRFFWGSDVNGPLYRLAFGVDGPGRGDSLSVSRSAPVDGATTWTITSSGAGELSETSENVSYGSFNVPFQMTLEYTGEGCSGE